MKLRFSIAASLAALALFGGTTTAQAYNCKHSRQVQELRQLPLWSQLAVVDVNIVALNPTDGPDDYPALTVLFQRRARIVTRGQHAGLHMKPAEKLGGVNALHGVFLRVEAHHLMKRYGSRVHFPYC
jgi:hypothetical protein